MLGALPVSREPGGAGTPDLPEASSAPRGSDVGEAEAEFEAGAVEEAEAEAEEEAKEAEEEEGGDVEEDAEEEAEEPPLFPFREPRGAVASAPCEGSIVVNASTTAGTDEGGRAELPDGSGAGGASAIAPGPWGGGSCADLLLG